MEDEADECTPMNEDYVEKPQPPSPQETINVFPINKCTCVNITLVIVKLVISCFVLTLYNWVEIEEDDKYGLFGRSDGETFSCLLDDCGDYCSFIENA